MFGDMYSTIKFFKSLFIKDVVLKGLKLAPIGLFVLQFFFYVSAHVQPSLNVPRYEESNLLDAHAVCGSAVLDWPKRLSKKDLSRKSELLYVENNTRKTLINAVPKSSLLIYWKFALMFWFLILCLGTLK